MFCHLLLRTVIGALSMMSTLAIFSISPSLLFSPIIVPAYAFNFMLSHSEPPRFRPRNGNPRHEEVVLWNSNPARPEPEPHPREEPARNMPKSTVDVNLFRPIHFQDENEPASPIPFVVKQTPTCRQQDEFCEEDPDYDTIVQRRFEQILQDSNLINDVFSEILVDPPQPLDNLTFTRSGSNFQSESPACLSYETIIYPKRGKTLNQDWVFILNQGETKQGIRVERCYSEGIQCQLGGGGLQFTVCRQKYIYKKMLTMDAIGSRILPESIYMPSCCVCYVQSDFLQTRTRTFSINQTTGEEHKDDTVAV